MLESKMESNVEGPLLGQPPEELALRVCGGPRDGHVVRLASPRCSVGSSDRCTLRLRGPGIRPLHCVILRGAARTVVRRWSPDTLLNGRDFADAPLTLGDQLSIGPILFEIVPAGSVSAPTTAQRDLAGELPPEPSLATRQDLDRRLEELTLRQSELEASQADIQLQERALAEAQERFRAECAARTQDQSSEQARLDALAEDLAARASRLDRREADIVSREDASEQGLPSEQDSYHTAADASYAGGAEPQDRTGDLSGEPAFEPVSGEAPLSAAAVLRRLGASAAIDGDDESPPPQAAPSDRLGSRQPISPGPDQGRSQTPDATGDDHEDSVANYMARLLERVEVKRSGQEPASATTIKRSFPPQPVAAPTIRPATPSAEDKPMLQQMFRRSTPELSADLSKMRELANENVRAVLDVHFRRKLYYMTIGKAVVAIVALLAGLLLLWWSSHGAPIAFYLATVSFAVTAVWMLQYAIAVGYLIRGRSKPDGPARGYDAVAAPEISRGDAESIDATPPATPSAPDEQLAAYAAVVAAAADAPLGEASCEAAAPR